MCKFKSKKKLINDDGEIENLPSSKTETIKEKVEVNLKPNVIWGKVIYSLRQMNLVALHTACGEIRNVEIDENVLTVFVKEEYLYNVLKAEDNFKNIEKVLRLIDNSLRLNVEKQIPEKNVVLENKKRLLKLFDEKLKIVD